LLATQTGTFTSTVVRHTLPLPEASVDVVISNGVLNLVLEKGKAFTEIRRVLRPGGRLQLGDIVLDAPLSAEARGDVRLWTQ